MARQVTTPQIRTVQEGPASALRLLVIIPAYNEEDSLGRVIRQVQEAVSLADIIVINDGSTDATSEIGEGYGATVLNLPYNLGIGSAMQTGFMYARDHHYDIAIQVDGDGQHDPSEITELIEALQTTDTDIVIGSRYIEDRGYITPLLRRTGIVILSTLISIIVQQRVTDPTSGFRSLNRRAIFFCAADYPFDYPEPEAVVILNRAGIRIKEISVTMNPRYGGESSITPLRSAYYMIKVILAIFLDLLRQPTRIIGEVQHVQHDHKS